MANEQISDFTALAAVPAPGDLLAVVDVSDTTDSATGTTKKITRSNALGAAVSTIVNTNHTATDANDVLFFDLSAGTPRTLTLEAAAGRKMIRYVKNLSVSTADLTIEGDGAETVDGALNIILAPGESVRLIPQASGAWESI